RGEEERPFQLFAAAPGGVFAADRSARAAGDGSEAGVGGQVSAGGEGRPVADLEQDAGSGPDADAWHRVQDRGKRVGIEHLLDLARGLLSLLEELARRGGELGLDELGVSGGGARDGLGGQGGGEGGDER